MLSAISSFIPGSLQLGDSNKAQGDTQRKAEPQKPPQAPTTDDDDTDREHDMAGDSLGVRKGTKKEKGSSETFIIVRPPPSKSNHPLNLQVQLVPPNARERSRRASSGAAVDEQGNLSRTTSNNSVYSSYSTSAGSVSSVGSTSTSSSARRMIIPLYNLQAHNVMTNVVADAGTDAKIAKFYKRGMEVIGLAVFEPTEVHGAGGVPQVVGGSLAPVTSHRSITPDAAHTPDSSRHSLSLSSSGHDRPSPPLAPAEPAPGPPPSAGKKLFGKLFRRKDAPEPSSPTTPTPQTPGRSQLSPGTPTPRSRQRASLILSPASEPAALLLPAVLGIQPALSAPTYPPVGRPRAYTWVVRRWLKGPGANDSLLGGVVSGVLGNALLGVGSMPSPALVEIRFEWTRGGKGRRGRKGASDAGTPTGSTVGSARRRGSSREQRRHSTVPDNASSSTASLGSQGPPTAVPGGAGAKKARRLSAGVRRSLDRSASPSRSIASASEDLHDGERPHAASRVSSNDGHDAGEDSDPEDSETPWLCTIVARRTGAQGLGFGGRPASIAHAPDPAQEVVRIKAASLSPTPHHPKVVALLKVPFPLPDVEVATMHVRRRVVTPAGIARPAVERTESGGSAKGAGARGPGGSVGGPEPLVLTAEEIKDVVSSTGMWLVVREGIGGVGRVSRKNDGWKIRS